MIKTSTVAIKILGNTYEIKCEDEFSENLINAAELVNNSMLAAKEKNISNEKAAILTAINMTYDLLLAKAKLDDEKRSTESIATEQIYNVINSIYDNIKSDMTKLEK
ncbi:MAG: cell division protein ZapA [Pseudomonadota bacterium]|nr:cell division protein ZapA [Pseudomonadota bacterium]